MDTRIEITVHRIGSTDSERATWCAYANPIQERPAGPIECHLGPSDREGIIETIELLCDILAERA